MKKQLSMFALVILGAAVMYGQATRTWVSGVGDDANPCSRTAPCKTFAGAISKTAAGGEIDALDPGGFGALTITKSITLDGGGGQVASVLVAGTNGIVVAAGATDVVTIRNIRIDGLLGNGSNSNAGLNGIRWISGKFFHVENCVIFGFNQSAIDIEKSDAVSGAQAFITGTIANNNAVAGLLVKNTSPVVNVTVTKSVINQNQFGIASQDFSHTTVFDTEISGNANTGVQTFIVSGGTSTADIYSSLIANNTIGLFVGPSTTANISAVALFNNSTGITPMGTVNSAHNNYNTTTGAPNGTITPQ